MSRRRFRSRVSNLSVARRKKSPLKRALSDRLLCALQRVMSSAPCSQTRVTVADPDATFFSRAGVSLREVFERLAVACLLHEVPQSGRKLRLEDLECRVKCFGSLAQCGEVGLRVAIA